MPIHKNNFQPKDPRAISNPYQDEDDLDDLFPTRKTMTGTQALVDFLKTTSPEEFQRPERLTGNIFSRMRKTKRVPSTRSVPPATNKKGNVELVAKSAGNSRAPSFDSQTLVARPILPNKKRESSLYSGSLRHSVSLKSTSSGHRRRLVSSHPDSLKLAKVATDTFVQASDGNDMIETALLQRLERVRILDQPVPSDQVAAGLATEHIRALGITHLLEQNNQEPKKSSEKKARHMQVQTMDWSDKTKLDPVAVQEEEENEEEVTRARRAELALEEALDNFEVISGLAYKKLREIWEEKMKWENACMELRDRLLAVDQDKRYEDSYFLEEDEDDLGLSEFPMQ